MRTLAENGMSGPREEEPVMKPLEGKIALVAGATRAIRT